MPIFAIRTTAGRESQVMEKIAGRVKQEHLRIYSILHPRGIKGYIFVEAQEREDINKAIFKVRNVKGVVGEVNLTEIEKFLEPGAEVVKINTGDIVEIIAGPFRGERGRVKRVIKQKDEVIVELLEAAVPIPVTLKLDAIKIVERKEDEGEN